MYYQQGDDFAFRQVGGYAMRPLAHSESFRAGADLVRLSDEAQQGPIDERVPLSAARSALCALSLRAIVVVNSVSEGPQLIDLAMRITERGPDHLDGGVSVWLIKCPDAK